MNSRERVIKTLNHENADRPPMDLGGAASGLNDLVYFNLKQYLGIQGDIEPFRVGTTVNYYDERILDHLEIDLRRLIMDRTDNFPVFSKDGSFVNEWGIRYEKRGEYYEVVDNPLRGASKADILAYAWPKAKDVFNVDGFRARAKDKFENSEHALVARMPCWGLIDLAFQIRGMEQFMMDMVLEPELARLVIEKILESQIDFYSTMLNEIGDFVQVVETCDDLGSQNGMLFSTKLFREIVKPFRKELNNVILQKTRDAKIFFHCCGAIYKLIPDLIDTGIHILNPLQPNALGMDPQLIKDTYGDQLCFHGCIDTQIALRGSVADTQEEVNKKINILSKNGGYIVAPANHIMSDVPLENIIALFDSVKKFDATKGSL